MSHSRIIQLSPVPVTEDKMLTPEDLINDYKVNAVSEYVNDINEDELDNELEDLQDSETFDGNAIIEGRKVTFADCETLKKNYDDWYNTALKKAAEKAGKERCHHGYSLRNLFNDFKNDTNLFVLDSVSENAGWIHRTALRSAELIGELAECQTYPRVWYIGAILDSRDA